jgi:hypothetical protein
MLEHPVSVTRSRSDDEVIIRLRNTRNIVRKIESREPCGHSI